MSLQLRNSGQKLLSDQIADAEQQLGVEFPADYRAFLLEHNGGCPRPDSFRDQNDDWHAIEMFLSVGGEPGDDLVTVTSELRNLDSMQLPSHLVAIAYLDESDLLVLSTSDPDRGAVFYLPFDSASIDDLERVKDSFSGLLDNLVYHDMHRPWLGYIMSSDLDGLQHWLDLGGDSSLTNFETGNSLIEEAAVEGEAEIVKMLLDRGVEPGSAALYALQNGHDDLAKLLVPRSSLEELILLVHMQQDAIHRDDELCRLIDSKLAEEN